MVTSRMIDAPKYHYNIKYTAPPDKFKMIQSLVGSK